ncbi:hypothetical protein [Nitriliruptor alkaliphilus]|uniref:hypothetical protein n=1 Tax=Nitriliruptor alkaliphilus TaxID=427918 RepID=UPI0012ED4BD2|nr:hypothetical protein [Nitriliruptor alkaliphilus]
MSTFRRMKDAAALVSAAPGLIDQAQQLATEAQLFAAAQQTVFTVGAVAPSSDAPGAVRVASEGPQTHLEV